MDLTIPQHRALCPICFQALFIVLCVEILIFRFIYVHYVSCVVPYKTGMACSVGLQE